MAGKYCRRCPHCLIDWPNNSTDYGKCPSCERETRLEPDGDPLDAGEARKAAAYYRFDRFLQAGEWARWPDDSDEWERSGHRPPGVVLAECEQIAALEHIPTLPEAA